MYSIEFRIQNSKRSWIEVAGIILLLATMFVGLTYRGTLSVGMLLVAFMKKMTYKATRDFLWTALSLAIFPLLPAVEPYPRVYVV